MDRLSSDWMIMLVGGRLLKLQKTSKFSYCPVSIASRLLSNIVQLGQLSSFQQMLFPTLVRTDATPIIKLEHGIVNSGWCSEMTAVSVWATLHIGALKRDNNEVHQHTAMESFSFDTYQTLPCLLQRVNPQLMVVGRCL